VQILYVIDADGLDPDCFERLTVCLGSLAQQTIAARITICLADYSANSVEPNLRIPENLSFRYFHRPLLERFNKPFCINYAFKYFELNKNDHFFLSDIDLIYPTDFVEYVTEKYRHIDDICVTGMTFYQDQDDSLYVADYDQARDAIYLDRRYRGGALMISSALFTELQGYDERYFGWGKEDDDFIMRCGDRGVFVVDESIEFVHMYHPDKSILPTINTELFLKRRLQRDKWHLPRPWGDWDHRPVLTEEYQWQFVAAYPYQSPMAHVVVNGDVLQVSNFEYPEPMKLDELGGSIWALCDGQNRFELMLEKLEKQFDMDTDILAHISKTILNQLSARKLITFSIEPQIRPTLRIGFASSEHNQTDRFNLIRSLEKHAEVWDVTADATEIPDILVHLDGAFEANSRATKSSTLNVYWNASLDQKELREDMDLFVTADVVPPYQRQSALRVPGWLRLFNWYADYRTELESSLLTIPDADPERKRGYIAIAGGVPGLLTNELMGKFSLYGQVSTQPAMDSGRIERFERFFDTVFVIIDEPNCAPGHVCDDFVLALIAGAIPVYRGDPLLHLDFNSARWIPLDAVGDVRNNPLIQNLVQSEKCYADFLKQPFFNAKTLPSRLRYHALGEKVFAACREKFVRANTESQGY